MANTIRVLIHRQPDGAQEVRACGQPLGWATNVITIDDHNGHPTTHEEAVEVFRKVIRVRQEVARLDGRTSVRKYAERWAGNTEQACAEFLSDDEMTQMTAEES